jgi:hypothetical protein
MGFNLTPSANQTYVQLLMRQIPKNAMQQKEKWKSPMAELLCS